MQKNRMEAFSDGVIAIIITIMVLELKIPHGVNWNDLMPLLPIFLCYVLSFIYLAIYWNNHHHLIHTIHKVNGKILWANTHLLFWLSLMPFVATWAGENSFASIPTFFYGIDLLFAAIAYKILTQTIIATQGKNALLLKAIGSDFKGIMSIVLYAFGTGMALFFPWISFATYIIVAIVWIIPDRRIENALHEEGR